MNGLRSHELVNVEQGRAVESSRCSKLIDSDVELRKRMSLRLGQPSQDWKDTPASMVLKKPKLCRKLKKNRRKPRELARGLGWGSHHVVFVHLTGVSWVMGSPGY